MSSNLSNNSNEIKPTNIALWGPSAVGKDWLFRSFTKELEYYNQQDNNYHYELLERAPGQRDLQPKEVEIPVDAPTPGIDMVSFVFRRKALNGGITQEHDLIIQNNNGQELVNSLDNSMEFETTFQILVQARNLFLVLGPPEGNIPVHYQSPDIPELQPEPDVFSNDVNESKYAAQTVNSQDKKILFDRQTYFQFMRRLFSSFQNNTRRNLAVCLTKCDIMNFRGLPQDMLELRYGLAMKDLLELEQKKHNIRVFATSAAGYLRQNGRWIPNMQGNVIRDTERWDPLNTAAPFFWIFDTIEKQRLESAPFWSRGALLKSYDPYPDPRPM